ncbi:hypothetical protein LguiA_008437 [Lonicera macranthoides]
MLNHNQKVLNAFSTDQKVLKPQPEGANPQPEGGGTFSADYDFANVIPVYARKFFAQPPVISAPVIVTLPPVNMPLALNVFGNANLIIIQSNNGQQMPVNHPTVNIPREPAVSNFSSTNDAKYVQHQSVSAPMVLKHWY